jgi:L-proline amide hydrolase
MGEGRMTWEQGWTYYRVAGELHAGAATADEHGEDPAPLVILHGGPGSAHDYLESIAVLAETAGRPCVLYDQIGCGRSQHLPDAPSDFWSPELFRHELDALLGHLGIGGRYHVLGQSWGGMLGMEHAVQRPSGLLSLVIANSPASMKLWIEETGRLRSLLPQDVQDVLTLHEQAGTTDSDDYRRAVRVFYERHLCRIPFPDSLERSLAQVDEDPTVYETMNGPSEFHVTGPLADWDITPQLGRVEVPCLVISGEFDEATEAVVRPLVEALGDARWELFEGTSHSTHLEQPERFLALVESFLAAHD